MGKNINTEAKSAKSVAVNGSSDGDTVQDQAVAENITGRGVFVIDTVPVGVAVRTAFLADDGRLLDIPAVFPSLIYALDQIDELKQLISQRFAEAAKIGNQVIAQQIEVNRTRATSDATLVAGQQSTSQIKVTSVATDDNLN